MEGRRVRDRVQDLELALLIAVTYSVYQTLLFPEIPHYQGLELAQFPWMVLISCLPTDFHLLARWRHRERIYPLAWINHKNSKIHETIIFEIVGSTQQRTMIPEKQETSKMRPLITSLRDLLSLSTGKRSTEGISKLPNLRNQSWELWETKAARAHRTEYWRESTVPRKNSRDL